MKPSRSDIHRKTHCIPEFGSRSNVSHPASATVFRLSLKEKFRDCFRHLRVSSIFGHNIVTLLLIVHLKLGYRCLHDICYHRDDPVALRLLGLVSLLDAVILCHAIESMGEQNLNKLRQFNCRWFWRASLPRTQPISSWASTIRQKRGQTLHLTFASIVTSFFL